MISDKNNQIKPISVKVERAELRKGKIIIVLSPDLLTNQEFAVNPFYNEGTAKNMLQEAKFGVWFTEKDGEIKIDYAGYNGTHYTTGHTQLHSINSMYLSKKDCAISEILKTADKYIEDNSRMNKLLSNWDNDLDFKIELKELISARKKQINKNKIKSIVEKYEAAKRELDVILKENISSLDCL